MTRDELLAEQFGPITREWSDTPDPDAPVTPGDIVRRRRILCEALDGTYVDGIEGAPLARVIQLRKAAA